MRRINYELRIKSSELKDIKEVAQYRYRFADKNGIVENEICPILIAYSDVNPKPDINDVEEWKWMKWEEFLEDIKKIQKFIRRGVERKLSWFPGS